MKNCSGGDDPCGLSALGGAMGLDPRVLVETSVQQVSAQKRVAGVVFNRVNEDRAKKYSGEYYHKKSYEKLFRRTSLIIAAAGEEAEGLTIACEA